MRTPLTLLGLVWAAFLTIILFAAAGDTSFLHIAAHLVQLPLPAPCETSEWPMRSPTERLVVPAHTPGSPKAVW